jgi:hypothetical protein
MEDVIEEILKGYRTIAIVGVSPRPERFSYQVAQYLKEQGYKIIPVNPAAAEVLDEKSYPSLRDIPEPVDVVDIFRRPEDVPPIVEDAIAIGAKVVWMQEGISHEEAARRAESAGLKVVMDHCMKKEHRRLFSR